MSRIIAFANHKGGVGKTASVAAIGSILAKKGYEVMMIDLDTQANLTRHFMESVPERTIYQAIQERDNIPAYRVRDDGLFLVPSSLDMAGIELDLSVMARREYVLADLLSDFQTGFDFILLDCPPSLGLVTMNAVVVADTLVVPTIPDVMSSYGVNMVEDFCTKMRRLKLNPDIDIDFIFFNRYEKRQNLTTAIETGIRSKYGDKVLNTVIRKNIDIAESALQFTDVVSYNPESSGAKDYTALVDEMLSRL